MTKRSKQVTAAALAALAATFGGTSPAVALMSFNVDQGTFNGDTNRYNAAVYSMTQVVNRYNVYGDFASPNIYVYYNSGIPTAQSNYFGSIGFGGTYPNERVAQHESNHYLGSGTIDPWYGQFNNAVWTGSHVNQLIQQFDGEGSVIRQSGVHFYGYGLNYDNEVTDNSILMRNVALMYAMRQDMGNGNGANPWSATNITLTASDPALTSAFNWFGGNYSGNYGGWSDKYFAHAGAAYSTGAFDMRTPIGTPNWTFAGDSLTVNAGGRLLYNSYLTSRITINNLILAGGIVRHDQQPADVFNLVGNAITVTANSTIQAANGNIVLNPPIGGTGGLTFTGTYSTTLNSVNTYTGGTTVNAGTLNVNAGGAAGGIRGALTVNSGATVRLTAADALGYGAGTSVSQITLNNGTLDNATSGNNGYAASWTLTGGTMNASGGGAYHIDAGSGRTITSLASATSSSINGKIAIRGANSVLPISVADGAAANDLVIRGAIVNSPLEAGNNGISKTGPGTLVLAGANTYTGATTVSAGGIAFTSNASNIGPVTMSAGTALRVGAAGPAVATLTTPALTLGSGGTLAFDFAGLNPTAPLISTGTFTATGDTPVSIANGGALLTGTHPLVGYTAFAGDGTFSPAAITLGPRSTGTLVNDGVGTLAVNVVADRPVWTGRDSGAWNIGLNGALKNWTLQTATSATDYLEGDNVLFDDTATGATTVVLGGNVSPAAVTFNNSAKAYTVTSSGGFGISGGGSFTKSGSGQATLSTANTFSGAVTVNGGTLYATLSVNPSNNATLSYVSGITVNNGGTLKAGLNSLFGYSGADDKPITVNSGGTLTTDTQGDVGVGLVVLNGGTMTTGGANAGAGTWRFQDATSRLSVTDNSTVSGVNYKFQNNAPIDVAAGKTLNFTGTITDTNSFGASSLIKNGDGTMLLAGANTFTGGLTINSGLVTAGTNANLGADTSPVTLNGGTLRITNGIGTARVLTVNAAGGTVNVTGPGQLYLSSANGLAGNGPLTVTGNGTLVASGAGNLRVGSTSGYAGAITLRDGGSFEYGTTGSVAAASTFTLGNEGELSVQGGGATSMPNAVFVNGGTNSVISFENGAAGVVTGPVTLNANLTVALRNWYNYSTVQSGTISGVISGAGNVAVNSGAGTGGTLTLGGNNTFTGNVAISNAIVAATLNLNDTTTGGRASGALGNEKTIGRTVTVNSGGTLSLAAGNILGSGGSSLAQAPALGIVVNSGGKLITAAGSVGGAGGGDANILGPLTLNGGILSTGNGYDANYQALILLKDVTVGGTSPSIINTVATSSVANGIMLGDVASGTDTITFTVADATADANADLTVSARFVNSANSTNNAAAIGALAKAGPGTMRLLGPSTYTGGTTVKGGTLAVTYTATGASASSPLLSGVGTDLQAGRVVFEYGVGTTPAATIRTLLAASFSAPTTPGVMETGVLRSSTATAARGLGYKDDGAGSVTVMATFFGDTDLDGGVAIGDFNTFAANFGQSTGKVWTDGDFDYDGGVGINDFNLLAAGFGRSVPTPSEGWASLLAFAAAHDDLAAFQAVTGVPEPTGLGVLAVGATVALRRRRRV